MKRKERRNKRKVEEGRLIKNNGYCHFMKANKEAREFLTLQIMEP
jgi:hypothetical protein